MNNEQLIKKYPKIFKINKPAQNPLDQRGIEFGAGWLNLLDILCYIIQWHVDANKKPQPTLAQAKEKMSKMTTYWDNTDEYIDGLICMAESLSYSICEYCGTNQNVSQNKKGWIKTLCKDCRNKTESIDG